MKTWILTPDKYLTQEEAKKLRQVTKNDAILAEAKGNKIAIRNWVVIDLALSTGLRVGEISNLKIKDLYIGRGQSQLLVRQGKGGKPRTVAVSSSLKNHLNKFLFWKKKIGEPIAPESYLFTSERGEKLSTRGLQHIFKQCAARAGLPSYYSIHSLRHTYGTMLYKASGWNLRLVQKELGHASIQTTQVYADVMQPDVEKAVNNVWE